MLIKPKKEVHNLFWSTNWCGMQWNFNYTHNFYLHKSMFWNSSSHKTFLQEPDRSWEYGFSPSWSNFFMQAYILKFTHHKFSLLRDPRNGFDPFFWVAWREGRGQVSRSQSLYCAYNKKSTILQNFIIESLVNYKIWFCLYGWDRRWIF